MNEIIGKSIYKKKLFIDEKVFVMKFVFQYKSSYLRDIIYKCYGYLDNTPQIVIDNCNKLISTEYKIIKRLSSDFPEHFIKTYDFLESKISLDKLADFEGGSYNLIGFTMEKMSYNLEEDFKKRFDNKNNYNDLEIYNYMRKTLESLCYMHKQTFCHRNINLQKFFIDSHDGILKLGDLGASKDEKKKIEVHEMTNAKDEFHSVVGEESYMAPEIFEAFSKKQAEARYDLYKADLFSLGITFLKLVSFDRIPKRIYFEGKDSHKKFIEDSLCKIKNPKFRECFEIMLEFDYKKRPKLIDFKKTFDIILKEEKEQHENSLNRETKIKKFEDINLRKDTENSLNQETVIKKFEDINSIEDTKVEYIHIDPRSISMIVEYHFFENDIDTFFKKKKKKNYE